MTAREKMKKLRNDRNISLKRMSEWTDVSVGLLNSVENGAVTHPKIVERIRAGYCLTEEEAEELLPKNHRKSDPGYDPDKFKAPQDLLMPVPTPSHGVDECKLYMSDYKRKKRSGMI